MLTRTSWAAAGRAAGVAAAALAVVLVAGATLTPIPGARPVEAGPLCLVCGEYGGIDVLLNVLLFVPLGVGLRLAGVRQRGATVAALALTVVVESLQLGLIAGRDASLGDLVSNTAGGALGALLAERWRGLALPSAGAAARLAWGWAALWLGLTFATARSTALAPGDAVVLYRRAAPLKRWGWFPGRVLRVAGGGGEITVDSGDGDGRFAVPARAPRGGPLRLEATVVSGGGARAAAAIATMPDPRARDVASLSQRRGDLVLAFRTEASKARVRVPGLVVRDLFPAGDGLAPRAGWPARGDTVRIAGEYSRQRLRLDVWWPGGHAARGATLHPFVAWSYLLPWGYGYGAWADRLSALWAAGLIAPAAYWAALAVRRRGARHAAPLAVAAVAALAGVAPATGASAPPLVVWLAVALGIAGGAAVGWRVARERECR